MPHRPIVGALLILLAAGLSQPTIAQVAPVVAPGSYVRVAHTALCCRSPVVGLLVSLETDSLRILTPGAAPSKPATALARTAITSLDVGQRVGAHKAAGAAAGLLIGALVGGVIGYSSGCSNCDGDWRPFGAVVVGGGGALLGVILGTAIGATQPHYLWTRARLATPGS